ncbi:MAG: 2-aminoethylphosphonate aminotransferase [Candidatus Omnitrophica bacterium CG11_big_fil_rev_8_21_14_0_20_64_10]|nr:MAG: 2-aminoethylphosphonate aminotransferase [Candidatus Omnitrophica bacterium CG11_big_fil_rev_8_21_14_0_20_64_10]
MKKGKRKGKLKSKPARRARPARRSKPARRSQSADKEKSSAGAFFPRKRMIAKLIQRRRRRLRRVLRKGIGPVAVPSKAAPAVPPVETPDPKKTIRQVTKRQILLCPGPVLLSLGVKHALAGPEICHREQEFTGMQEAVRAKLIHALGLDGRWTSVLIGGSGTAALESAILSAVDPSKKLLVVNNGVYGSRIAQIAKIHGIPLVEVRAPLTEAPALDRVHAALKRERGIGTVAMVHHETSTGMLNPVEAVGGLAKKLHKRFLVDAISSLGAERLDLDKAGVDLCVGSAGKALHGAPGLSFVLVNQSEVVRIQKQKPRSLYLDLAGALKSQESGEPPFTPAVPLVAAFHAALNELIKEGLKSRIAKYRQRSVFLRQGFKKLKLEFLLPEKDLSNSLTALMVPTEISYTKLHALLRKGGFVIYAGQSELREKIFRVAHMGGLLQSDLKLFLSVLKTALSR